MYSSVFLQLLGPALTPPGHECCMQDELQGAQPCLWVWYGLNCALLLLIYCQTAHDPEWPSSPVIQSLMTQATYWAIRAVWFRAPLTQKDLNPNSDLFLKYVQIYRLAQIEGRDKGEKIVYLNSQKRKCLLSLSQLNHSWTRKSLHVYILTSFI